MIEGWTVRIVESPCVFDPCPGRSAARSGALQIRDRQGRYANEIVLWRSRISGAALRAKRRYALHRIRDRIYVAAHVHAHTQSSSAARADSALAPAGVMTTGSPHIR